MINMHIEFKLIIILFVWETKYFPNEQNDISPSEKFYYIPIGWNKEQS